MNANENDNVEWPDALEKSDAVACPVERIVMCQNCGQPATANLQMTTHQCDPIPMCDHCLNQNAMIAQEINRHEMENFGGAYGLVTYEVLPL